MRHIAAKHHGYGLVPKFFIFSELAITVFNFQEILYMMKKIHSMIYLIFSKNQTSSLTKSIVNILNIAFYQQKHLQLNVNKIFVSSHCRIFTVISQDMNPFLA